VIPSIQEIDIAEKRVFIRADLDVPLTSEGEIGDDTKILRALRTIRYAIGQKAKVIVASHLGKPRGKLERKYTLETVGGKISELLDRRIYFPENSIGRAVKKVTVDMLPGEVMLLENLDFHKKELSAGSDYARELSEIADVYVNDAFSISNQNRASVTVMPEFFDTVSMGLDFKRELESLERLQKPEKPFVVILGGSRVDRKIGFMESMVERVDVFLTGGVVANTFLKAKGVGTGQSEIDQICLYRAKKLISGTATRDIKLILPDDVIAAEGNLRNHGTYYIISRESIPGKSKIMDIGYETVKGFKALIEGAGTVLWSGPLGIFEKAEFTKGTSEIAGALRDSSSFTAALGEHTVGILDALGIEENTYGTKEGINFISRGGESSLAYIENGTLPAITALEKRIK
jgi:phosphoglycerate kinase